MTNQYAGEEVKEITRDDLLDRMRRGFSIGWSMPFASWSMFDKVVTNDLLRELYEEGLLRKSWDGSTIGLSVKGYEHVDSLPLPPSTETNSVQSEETNEN